MQRAVVAASCVGTPADSNNEVAVAIAEPIFNVGISYYFPLMHRRREWRAWR